MVPTTSGALDDLCAETAHVRQMSSRWLPTKCDLARRVRATDVAHALRQNKAMRSSTKLR